MDDSWALGKEREERVRAIQISRPFRGLYSFDRLRRKSSFEWILYEFFDREGLDKIYLGTLYVVGWRV